MRLIFQKILGLLFITMVITSCSKDDEKNDNGDSKPKAEKGYVSGKVVDTKGEPIAEAKILLESTVFYNSHINASTDATGNYKIKVQAGAWNTYGTFKKEYNGITYTLPLSPDGTDSFTEEGGIRNFTWKLEGTDPGNEHYFYGGQVSVSSDIGFYEEQEDIELTFTPSGPLIDGSEGKTLILRYGDHYWKEYHYVKDIPIGRYMVTAILKKPDSDVPLKIQNWHIKGDFVSELQLDFIPDDTFRPVTEASVVIGYDNEYIH